MVARPSKQPICEGPSPGLRAAALLWGASLMSLGIVSLIWIDVLVGTVLMLAAVFGWRGFSRGGLRSLMALVAMLAVGAWALPVGRFMTPAVHLVSGLPRAPARFVAIIVVAGFMLLLGEVLGVWLARWVRARHGIGARTARGLGQFFGTAEGAVLGLMLGLTAVAVEPPIRMALSLAPQSDVRSRWAYRQLGKFRSYTRKAPLAKRLAQVYAQEHEVLHLGGGLALLSRYPNALQELRGAPEIVQLRRSDPTIARIVEEIKLDPVLKDGVRHGDVAEILNSQTVIRLLDDVELAAALGRHRQLLLHALIDAVPGQDRSRFMLELSELHGMTPENFRRYAGRFQRPPL